MNLFFLLIGCVPCCAPELVEVEPVKQFDNFDNQEKIKTDPVRCEPDVRDCYIEPKVNYPVMKYVK